MIKVIADIQKAEPKYQYPWIGISGSGNIVLFYSYGRGTLLKPAPNNTTQPVGHPYDNFNMGVYTAYFGNITLSNK